jgi:hypothetical protein
MSRSSGCAATTNTRPLSALARKFDHVSKDSASTQNFLPSLKRQAPFSGGLSTDSESSRWTDSPAPGGRANRAVGYRSHRSQSHKTAIAVIPAAKTTIRVAKPSRRGTQASVIAPAAIGRPRGLHPSPERQRARDRVHRVVQACTGHWESPPLTRRGRAKATRAVTLPTAPPARCGQRQRPGWRVAGGPGRSSQFRSNSAVGRLP